MQDAETLYDRALDCFAAGQLEQSIALLHEALARDAQYLDAQHALTRVLAEAGRFDEALRNALALAAHTPDDPLAYTALSILYQRIGNIAEAEAAATRAKLLGWKQQLRESRHAGGAQ
jgi:tetratricopeptide (TPR) repeat protein